ncbi:flavodoxin family protein [Nocardia jejuensis]|uniref:flavodoxin family protein n=1 Tax=Nocardia jejuensis TaxID=328049 RepID=UPI0008364D01|nr:flavodoxin family protein [Nocardia jejuensis]
MKTLIVCTSVSHGNTRRVADAIAPILGAHIVAPDEADHTGLSSYDLVGFGSGIFLGAFHADLRGFIESLPETAGTKAFVFATSGFADAGFQKFSRPLVRQLEGKGFEVVDTFSCRALDTYFPFKPLGGIRKGHPDSADFESARNFADSLRTRLSAP